MGQLLIRVFIKDFENVNNPKVYRAYGKLAGLVGIVCNILLASVKLMIGIASSSASIVADAVNNIADVISSAVGVLASFISGKKTDSSHPFGYGRDE